MVRRAWQRVLKFGSREQQQYGEPEPSCGSCLRVVAEKRGEECENALFVVLPGEPGKIDVLGAGNDPALGQSSIERARARATPVVIDVLSRYPPARFSNNRVARLMVTLDTALRLSR